MAEQTDSMIDVEFKIEIIRCLEEAISAENVATNWL